MSFLTLKHQWAPSNTRTNHSALFVDATDGRLYLVDPTNTSNLIPFAPITGASLQPRMAGHMENIGFSFGSTTTLTICQANGSAFADTDGSRGYIWLPSTTSGQLVRFAITANVTILLTGAYWGLTDDTSDALLRVYAINDGGTLKWGVGYCGGFGSLRNTQDSTTPSDINLPEEILVNANISTDHSPCVDVGYLVCSFDYTGGASEKLWTILSAHPGRSADGIWQTWVFTQTGFSANPTYTLRKWMQIGCNMYVSCVNAEDGTSNSWDKALTLPIKARHAEVFPMIRSVSNGTAQVNGHITTSAGSQTINIYRNQSRTAWTSSILNGWSFSAGPVEVYSP